MGDLIQVGEMAPTKAAATQLITPEMMRAKDPFDPLFIEGAHPVISGSAHYLWKGIFRVKGLST